MPNEDQLYREYLRVVEGHTWFRTYYAGDAYANETFENLEQAKKHWDKELIVEPIEEPTASGPRDGFTYVRVTQRHVADSLGDDVKAQRRILAAIQAKGRSLAFTVALRKIVQQELSSEATEDHLLWACLTATVPQYLEAAIHAMTT
ncbi:MAG: hypothetical protein QM758_01355 [Armatimonas sp.]